MAERTDITFDFNDYRSGGPREITVDIGGGDPFELTVQDLVDTVRVEEAKLENLIYKQLLTANSGGKAAIDAVDVTDINLEFFNAVVGGEADAGPGTTKLNIIGGTIAAVDLSLDFADPIFVSAFRQVNYRASRSGVIVGTNVASDVWGAQLSANQIVGSFGEWVGSKLLSVAKFLGLK